MSNGPQLAQELGEQVLFIELDVTSEESGKSLVEETEKAFRPIDILINNASISLSMSIEDMSYAQYQKTIKVNQDGVFLGMKYVYRSMKKTPSGSIVNISSAAGIVGGQNNSAYIASKFALRGLTKAAAAEFAKDYIRVNSVHPGAINTAMNAQEDDNEIVQAIIKTIPLKRIADPEEITKLVLFLASDDSSYSTGVE